MGIKERHERDREAVSRAILDAARELFVTEGYQNVSIRKIAERIEYSPAAIYGYFPCKDDIFFALAEEGFRLLGDPDARSRRGAAGARTAGSAPRDFLARLRVRPAAPPVLLADVHRPRRAADQPGIRAVRLRPRHEGEPGRPDPVVHRRQGAAFHGRRVGRVPHADDGRAGGFGDAAVRSSGSARAGGSAGPRRPERTAGRPAVGRSAASDRGIVRRRGTAAQANVSSAGVVS